MTSLYNPDDERHDDLATFFLPVDENQAEERNAMPERIGDYLIRTGAMNQSQVDEVVRLKTAGDQRHFGDIAVSLGFIKAANVEAFLAAQK